MSTAYHEKVGSNSWKTTRSKVFRTRCGDVPVPGGFVHDLFSVVPNTEHPEFWEASTLHDWIRFCLKHNIPCVVKNIRSSDIVFYDEMLIQSAVVFNRLNQEKGIECAVKEFLRLLKVSKLYYFGVSGWFGKIYQWFAG